MTDRPYAVVESASQLPDRWDDLAEGNVFLTRTVLERLEAAHPRGQRYHLFFDSQLDSIFVSYRRRIPAPLLGWQVPTTVIGVPCTVSKSGYRIGHRTRDRVLACLFDLPGMKVVVQATDDLRDAGYTRSRFMPSYHLAIRWETLEEYVESMRSTYRRRIQLAQRRCPGVAARRIDGCGELDDAAYRLYLQVFDRVKTRGVRPVDIEVFRTMPGETVLLERERGPIAFARLVPNGDQLLFFKGGMDYAQDHNPDLYLLLLLEVVRTAIEEGYRSVDMGQYSGGAKLRLGCRPHPMHLYIAHSNPIANAAAGIYARTLPDDDAPAVDYHVFRQKPPSRTATSATSAASARSHDRHSLSTAS